MMGREGRAGSGVFEIAGKEGSVAAEKVRLRIPSKSALNWVISDSISALSVLGRGVEFDIDSS